jgi:hypothetical protein
MGTSDRAQALSFWAMIAVSFVCVPATLADSPVAGARRAVVELFTSQGCSSCPPADAIAGRLRTLPELLVLSFHVNYWDGLGWKDPFGSQDSTNRQNAYARSLREHSVFTPQVIVNGTASLVGSQEGAIKRTVEAMDRDAFPVQAVLVKQPDGGFALSLQGPVAGAEVWEIRYVSYSATRIRGGENGGRTLETYNNVTHIRRLGASATGTFKLPPLDTPDDGLAIIVQASGMGGVLGATAY